MKWAELTDSYVYRARLQPALLVLFPVFTTVAAWSKPLYDAASGLLGVAIACGMLGLFGHIVRTKGRAVEPELFSLWGGAPTARFLSHKDATLDDHTKARYASFLERRVPDWRAPSLTEEISEPESAAARYESASNWLRENRRSNKKFPLVSVENAAYGFRRNLYGVRVQGAVTAILAMATNIAGIAVIFPSWKDPRFLLGAASAIVSALAVVAWIFLVNANWVRDAADGYARALLASCDRQ